jgi:hypothetical protein
MKLKSALLAALAGSAAIAAPAFADNGWHRGWERHEHRSHYYYAPRVVVVPAPAPRVYYPSGVYYTPPVVAYPPAQVAYAPAPVYPAPQPGISIRFRLPL